MLASVVSETPTEPASPRTLARARARGDLPYAAELPLSLLLLTAVALSSYPAARLLGTLRGFSRSAWRAQLTASQAWRSLYEMSVQLGLVLAAPALAAGVALLAQRLPSSRWFVGAAERQASARSAQARSRPREALFPAFKALLLCAGMAGVLYNTWPGLLSTYERDASELLAICARVLRALCLRAALLLLLLAAIELGLQQVARLRRLRMTRQQVQDEQRELVGDPRMLAERRARAKQGPPGQQGASRAGQAQRSSPQLRAAAMAQLSAATLLITGAARVVALRYEPQRAGVPIVWLTGEGAHALELLQRAYSLELPLVSDAQLAEALSLLEPTAAIPPEWHARVAQLLVGAGIHAPGETS